MRSNEVSVGGPVRPSQRAPQAAPVTAQAMPAGLTPGGKGVVLAGVSEDGSANQDGPAARPWVGSRPWARWFVLALVITLSAAMIIWRRQLAGWHTYGYPGLFLVNLIGNATLLLPAPVLVVVFAAGSSLAPPLVGLAAGSGAALGELTGYLAGFSGSAVIENQARYAQMHRWMAKWGVWVIFVLSLIPNPLFDLAGITAGTLRLPLWRFLLACWTGKVLKMTVVAYMGGQTVDIIQRLLPH